MIVNISKITVLVALALYTSSVYSASDPIVEISDGKILGHVMQSKNNSDFYAFQQIPFAAPPVGDLRFAEPVNPKPWDGVLNATENTKICVSGGIPPSLLSRAAIETEDCLYLNVYTPVQPGTSEKLLPVLLWIYGGAFMRGSVLRFGPEWLIDYDIVLVIIQYRVGPLGFASTGDGVIPGNLGLKDQRQALRWVQSNIKAFGGDPKRVTLTGQSAGAISVSYLLLDPNSKGLFSGAIQESGSAIMRGSFVTDVRNKTFEWAKSLNQSFNSNDSEDLLKLLREVSAEDIVKASSTGPPAVATGFWTSLKFAPVIEEENDRGNEYLLTTPMHESFLNGNFSQVPVLLGFTSEESVLSLVYSVDGADNAVDYDANYSMLIDYRLNVAPENLEAMGKELKEIYTYSNFVEDLGSYVRYTSDVVFINAVLKQAECSTKYVPTYLYQFSYAGELGSSGRVHIPGAEDVGHGEDQRYLWNFATPEEPPVSDADLVISRRLLKMWTNFVKYQNPTPDRDEFLHNIMWPTTNSSDLRYLNINNTDEVRTNPRYYAKVNALHEKYMRPPLTVM